MKTLTIKVDENSIKGMAFLEFIEALYSEQGDVQLSAIDGVPINNRPESGSNFVAESGAKYKTSRKTKKEPKPNLETEESPYNPEFVKMVLEAAKGPTTRVIDPSDIWGSLGLK
ncbi:DUF2683 family protein [Flavobacterium antarcticum]|uniref:DUF2683 family protein n=1 Tax=Flavobacterium antarcticum TaxID=271155 RepID=UPI00040A5213|nr:DUF2683 family protein [Flavobacterium antarcticum]